MIDVTTSLDLGKTLSKQECFDFYLTHLQKIFLGNCPGLVFQLYLELEAEYLISFLFLDERDGYELVCIAWNADCFLQVQD